MNPVVEKRRSVLINAAYFALIIAIFYLIFKTFFGLLLPFIVAFMIAALLQKPVNFISRKTPVKRSLAGTLCILLLIGIIAALLFLAGLGLIGKVKDFYQYVTMRLSNVTDFILDIKNWLISTISFLPDSLRLKLNDSITVFFDELIKNGFKNFSISSVGIDWSSVLSKGGGVLKDTVGQIPSVIIGCVISLVAATFMTADYPRIKAFIRNQFSDNNAAKISEASKLASQTFKNMVKAYGKIICVTFAELLVGFYVLYFLGIFNSAYIPFIALIIAVIDIIPVLGTGTVLVPWAIYSFITGKVSMGIGLLIIYVIILVIRQVLEPKLVAGQVGLPAFVTIIAMYVGTKTLGVLGFFILPFIVILLKEFNDRGIVHLFRSSSQVCAEAEADEAAPAETEGKAELESGE